MKKLLATLTCFLLATCWVSAQSPNTDLQPVKSKAVKFNNRVCIPYIMSYGCRIIYYCDSTCRIINLEDLLSLINFGSTLEFYVDGRKLDIQERLAFQDKFSYQKKNVYPRNFYTLGTPAAYSYDNKYIYKPMQAF